MINLKIIYVGLWKSWDFKRRKRLEKEKKTWNFKIIHV